MNSKVSPFVQIDPMTSRRRIPLVDQDGYVIIDPEVQRQLDRIEAKLELVLSYLHAAAANR